MIETCKNCFFYLPWRGEHGACSTRNRTFSREPNRCSVKKTAKVFSTSRVKKDGTPALITQALRTAKELAFLSISEQWARQRERRALTELRNGNKGGGKSEKKLLFSV